MGTSDLRDALALATGNAVAIQSLTLSYDHADGPNHQVIEINGVRHSDGTPFHIKTRPFHPKVDPMTMIPELARRALEGGDA